MSAFRARPLAVFWSCTELIYFIVRSALGLSWPPTSIYALLRSLYALGSSSPSAWQRIIGHDPPRVKAQHQQNKILQQLQQKLKCGSIARSRSSSRRRASERHAKTRRRGVGLRRYLPSKTCTARTPPRDPAHINVYDEDATSSAPLASRRKAPLATHRQTEDNPRRQHSAGGVDTKKKRRACPCRPHSGRRRSS